MSRGSMPPGVWIGSMADLDAECDREERVAAILARLRAQPAADLPEIERRAASKRQREAAHAAPVLAALRAHALETERREEARARHARRVLLAASCRRHWSSWPSTWRDRAAAELAALGLDVRPCGCSARGGSAPACPYCGGSGLLDLVAMGADAPEVGR